MRYDWLFSFVVFADHLNFTRAARELHITQPALHAQIRKLSEQIGTPLYRRAGRSLVLSAEGRRLAAFGREVQARGNDVLSKVRGEDTRSPVVLASGQGAFLYLLGPTIKRFPKHRWPLRAISMTGPQIVDAVRDARADVGVTVLATSPTDLECVAMRRVGQVVLLPRGHRLSKRRSLEPSDLDGESIVIAPEGSPHRTMLSQAMTTAGAKWTVAVEATGWELMIQFARYGMGIAVVNDFCPVPRGLTGVPLREVPDVEYRIVTRPGATRESTATLVRMIQESAE